MQFEDAFNVYAEKDFVALGGIWKRAVQKPMIVILRRDALVVVGSVYPVRSLG